MNITVEHKPPVSAAAVSAPKSRTGKVAIVVAIALSGLLLGGYAAFSSQQKPAGDPVRNTIKIKRGGAAQISVIATGTIRPVNEVKISPKQAGVLKALLVKQGTTVKAGQLIAMMDDSNLLGDALSARGTYLASMDNFAKMKKGNRPQEIAQSRFQELKAQSGQRQARVNISRLEAQMAALAAQLKRNEAYAQKETFLAKEGAVSEQAMIDADTAAQVTRLQLSAAQREREQAEAALVQSQEELNSIREQRKLMESGYRPEDIAVAEHNAMQAKGQLLRVQTLVGDTRIKAPFDGVITQKYADKGAFVTPTTSSSTTSATSSSIVALAGKLDMVAQVSESNIAKIKVGQPVEITATAYPDRVFRGHVCQIAPAAIVTSNVTTFEVHADVDGDVKHELLAGMNVSAKFIVGTIKDAILVPTTCVISRKGQTGVYMPDKDGQPAFKPVQTGPTVGRNIVILSGLAERDRVFRELSKEQMAKEGYTGRGGSARGGSVAGAAGAMRSMGGGGAMGGGMGRP